MLNLSNIIYANLKLLNNCLWICFYIEKGGGGVPLWLLLKMFTHVELLIALTAYIIGHWKWTERKCMLTENEAICLHQTCVTGFFTAFSLKPVACKKERKKRGGGVTNWPCTGCAAVGLEWSVCICWSLQDWSSVEKAAWLSLCWVQQSEQSGCE